MSAVDLKAWINRYAPGVLDFLGIKSNGRLPPSFDQGLQPTFDMLPWYAAAQWENLNALNVTLTGMTRGDVYCMLQPADVDVWLVRYAGVIVRPETAQNGYFQGGVNMTNGVAGQIIATSRFYPTWEPLLIDEASSTTAGGPPQQAWIPLCPPFTILTGAECLALSFLGGTALGFDVEARGSIIRLRA